MQRLTRCNPLVIHPSGDTTGCDDRGTGAGRYEVWCRRCGSTFTDSWELARQMVGDHRPTAPAPDAPADPVRAAAMHDWSESVSARLALEPS